MICSNCSWCGAPGGFDACEECAEALDGIRSALHGINRDVAAVMLEAIANELAGGMPVSMPRFPADHVDKDDDSATRFSLLELVGNPSIVVKRDRR